MRIVEPSVEVTFYMPEDGKSPEEAIEIAARNCYKSEGKIKPGSAAKLVRKLKKRGHFAMTEFGYATAHIIADRGLTHELVRHRMASFAQESTRYCNYSKNKFDSEITVVAQPDLKGEALGVWEGAMEDAEKRYMILLKNDVPAEIARSVLPIGLKSEIIIGANLREWRYIFKMRCASSAHPIIRGIMLQVLKEFNEKIPTLYEDQAEEFL